MRRKEICRSEEFCNTIWDIYEFFENLDRRYMWFDRYNRVGDKKELYYLDNVNIGTNGMRYAYYPMGQELPCSKNEWVELVLKRKENGSLSECRCRITVDALRENQKTVQELLKKNNLRIPDEQELLDAEYEDEIPVFNVK